MKRVLHILNKMSPGGAESLIMNLYRNIDKSKVQFDFWVADRGIYDDEIIKMGGKIFYTEPLQKCGLRKYLKNWSVFLDNHKEYRIIHSHLNNVSGFLFKIAKKKKVPIRIIHSHTSETVDNIVVKISKKYLNHLIIKYATLLLGCSDKANEWLYGKHKEEAIILNNGIDIDKFKYNETIRDKIRKELNVDENTMIIGHVGRLVKVKNHKYLIDVFEKYHKKNSNSKLVIIGDGDMKSELEKVIEHKNMKECVIMLGLKTNINEYMQAFDCFIFPSFYEGLPVTLVEAQTSGLPVLASNRISEMIKIIDTFKFLSIDSNPSEWVPYILKSDDRIKYSEIVRNAGFDIKLTGKEYIELLEVQKRGEL